MFLECEFEITILIIAVKGTDRNIPIIPHKYPQTNKEMSITRGFKPSLFPNIFGSIMLPITFWKKIMIATINRAYPKDSYCTSAVNPGKIVEITDPMFGIKFSSADNIPQIM